ncbi:hypothetical protein PFDG_04999 [Plasmodium falciparum Dd2]|uniref:Uncharacterized protein n=1 Tax=Plasmodium falciparum (isolate Dd2) TaxID=57267 RepID=A0A0L7MA39_PLAF4|nr:hypothetical protein PFDG_04999 [Plasmodium falciparum Dd2]
MHRKNCGFLQQLRRLKQREILYSEYDSKVAFDVTNCLKDNIILICTEQTNYSPVLLENESTISPPTDICLQLIIFGEREGWVIWEEGGGFVWGVCVTEEGPRTCRDQKRARGRLVIKPGSPV